MVTDFEDDSVVARVTDFERLTAADCAVGFQSIPARGQRSLELRIGATQPDSAVGVGLRFRLATAFESAQRIAAFVWIDEKEVDVSFRLRDVEGRLYQTRPQTLSTHRRWVRVVSPLGRDQLLPLGHDATNPEWPLEVAGFQVRAKQAGRQRVLLDDVEIEHAAAPENTVRARFRFNKPTQLYAPDEMVHATVEFENLSRSAALALRVELAWLRSDDSEAARDRATISLPASGVDYRSWQAVDSRQRFREPGMLRLVATVRADRWPREARFETGLTITPSNSDLPRGRETFFGLRSNLMHEPLEDQRREIQVLSELGAQLIMLDAPWSQLEPSADASDFTRMDELLREFARRDVAVVVKLTDPPAWLPDDSAKRREREAILIIRMATALKERLSRMAPLDAQVDDAYAAWFAGLSAALREREYSGELWPPSAPPPGLALEGGVGRIATTHDDALEALNTLRGRPGWSSADRWLHRAEPRSGVGIQADAVHLLRFLVAAAEAGVGGVIWDDLRDDTVDPRLADQMRGLVRRDFSPKAAATGFASAVGMLSGLACRGPGEEIVPGLRATRFFAPRREVLVVVPDPGVTPPLALSAWMGAEGELTAFDFERRPIPLTMTRGAPPLVPASREPFYVVFTPERSQDHPSLRIAEAWLRAPRIMRLADRGALRVELTAPADLKRSFLAVSLPRGAPVRSSLSTRSLQLAAGAVETIDVELTREGPPGDPLQLSLEINLEGERVIVPVRLLPATRARAVAAPAELLDQPGEMLSSSDPAARPAQAPRWWAGTSAGRLLLVVTPPAQAPQNTTLTVALSDAEDGPTLAQVNDPWRQPASENGPADWRYEVMDVPDGGKACVISIPVEAALINTRSVDLLVTEPPPTSFLPERVWRLGRGAAIHAADDGYRWLVSDAE